MPFNPVPLLSSDLSLRQSWYKLQKQIDAAIAALDTGSGLGATLYVSPVGDDATAQRGSIVLKYQTLQAAVDAAQTGDAIVVGPGTYTEDIVLRDDVDNISIIGAGPSSTILQNATAAPTVQWTGATGIQRLQIANLQIVNTGADACLLLDGTAVTDLFEGGLCLLQDVIFLGAGLCLDAIRATSITLTDCAANDLIRASNVSNLNLITCSVEELTLDYDAAQPEPNIGLAPCRLNSCRLAGPMNVNNLCQVEATDTVCRDILTNLVDEATPRNGYVLCKNSYIYGNIGVNFDWQNVAADTVAADFDGSHTYGAFLADGTASINRGVVSLRSGVLGDAPGNTIIGANNVLIDITGSTFNQSLLGGAAAVARDRHILPVGTIQPFTGAPGPTQPFTPPFPTTNYIVTVEPSPAAPDVTWMVFAKTTFDVDLQGFAVGAPLPGPTPAGIMLLYQNT